MSGKPVGKAKKFIDAQNEFSFYIKRNPETLDANIIDRALNNGESL